MSQGAVEKTIGKLVTDECFRGRFFRDPAGASFSAGLELSQAELDALSRLPVKAIARFSGSLDDRIRRVPLDEEGRVPSEGSSPVRRRRTAIEAGRASDSAQNLKEDQG
jgi:hypothetical protein